MDQSVTALRKMSPVFAREDQVAAGIAEDSWDDFALRGNRLLVIDDRLERQTELTNRFRRFGYSVAVANGAEEAIRILDTEPGFDFAIYDPESMGEPGVRLARHCASCSDLNQIKLIPLFGSRDTIADDVFAAVGVWDRVGEELTN